MRSKLKGANGFPLHFGEWETTRIYFDERPLAR